MTRLLVALLVVAGCGVDTKSTLGQRGRARFSYVASPGCEDGCNLNEFYVAGDGAKQQIRVRGPGFATVESAAPAVASFAPSGDGVEVTTAAAGDTDLVLRDAAGGEVDRVSVHVGEVKQLLIEPNWPATGAVVLEGVAMSGYSVKKIDALQRLLLGTEGVHFSTGGTVTSLGRPEGGSIIESMRFQGTPGRGSLDGVNAGARVNVPIIVARVDELSRIGAMITNTVLGPGGHVESYAQVNASTPDGMAYGMACAWTVSDPSLEIHDDVQPLTLDRPPLETLTFRITKVGKFTATCAIGRLDVTLNLERL